MHEYLKPINGGDTSLHTKKVKIGIPNPSIKILRRKINNTWLGFGIPFLEVFYGVYSGNHPIQNIRHGRDQEQFRMMNTPRMIFQIDIYNLMKAKKYCAWFWRHLWTAGSYIDRLLEGISESTSNKSSTPHEGFCHMLSSFSFNPFSKIEKKMIDNAGFRENLVHKHVMPTTSCFSSMVTLQHDCRKWYRSNSTETLIILAK